MLDRRVKNLGSAALALGAIAAAGWLSFQASREHGLRQLHERAERQLAVYGAALFAPTDKYSYLPEIVAKHPAVIDALRHHGDRRLLQQADVVLDRLNSSARSAVIYVMDRGGKTIASSNWQQPHSFLGQNYAFRPYFQDALREGSGRFYGIGTTSMLPGYYISHAIRDGDAVLGVAAVKVELNDIDAGWKGRAPNVEAAVTDENGVIFLSSRPEWKYRPTRPLSEQAKEELRRTRQYGTQLQEPLPIATVKNLAGDERLVRVRQNGYGIEGQEEKSYLFKTAPLAGSDWSVNVLVPTEEADRQAMRTGAVGAGVLAFIMLAFMYVRLVRRRIRDRERSRRELEQTHRALEQQHRELQQLTEELRVTSITDPLTGAYNRRFFFETVGKLASSAQRHRSDLSIVIIDVDHFKRINDAHGHPAGDKALQTLTAICQETLRETDVFARFGGEEFIMALPHSDSNAAFAVAERLRVKVLAQPVEIGGERLHITLSCGVSQYRIEEAGIEDTLRRADEALYAAKNGGRNQVVLR